MKRPRKGREQAATANALPFVFSEDDNMNDINTWTQIISSIGFPIAACCAIFYMLNKEREDHKSEVDSLKSVLSEVKETMAALKQLIEDKL